MKCSIGRTVPVSLVILLTLASVATAQWSPDPALNLAIADRGGEVWVPKIRDTSDGGCYVGWFDNSAGGGDVYLQRLDAQGNEQWAHNGILIADRSFMWVTDWGLDVDAAGNAVLAFRDDRTGTVQVTLARVSPDGTTVEVTPTSGPADRYSPKIAATHDGGYVVGWISDLDTIVQKRNADLSFAWERTLSHGGGGSISLCDVKASEIPSGSVIVSWVRQGPDFWDPKHLWTQKFSAVGDPLWGPSGVCVFDGGSLQFGNFPPFVPDGSGGAVFGWYSAIPSLQCYVQRILADGSEVFPHNGVPASTSFRDRAEPSVSFKPDTEEIFLFWREQQLSGDGVYGQKFASDGTRQWTDEGKAVVPLGDKERCAVRNLQYLDGAYVFFEETLAFGNQRLYGARVDTAGNPVWSPSLVTVSSAPSGKMHLDADLSAACGNALLAWADDRAYAPGVKPGVYGQNVNPDGSLAPKPELIPAVSEWGIVIMMLLLLTGMKIEFGRRAAARA